MTRVAVLGAGGYAGGEVLRLLLAHPAVEVVQATSEQHAGKRLDFPHPHLRGLATPRFSPHDALEPCDVLFSCMPSGELIRRWPQVSALAGRIVDLSADFRLEPAEHARWYPRAPRPADLPEFVYGLPEWTGARLKDARFVAVPGCMAHAALLALLPLVRAGLVKPEVVVDAKTGSSGGGATPDRSSHHPERASALRCYRAVGHRHTGEIEGVTERLAGVRPVVHFSATAVPSVRGVLATVHAFAARKLEDASEPLRALASTYREHPFVHVLRANASASPFPEPAPLAGTNHCDLAVEVDAERGRIVVNAALDNLVKGAAGTAVHALNLMLGRPETEGLGFRGLHPL
ncbi:N-acetyl-gamma-glutamyl-phosphate reductase [Myxococcus qinghaiensis]|uniref:N-acetyl-gamma-glutamyl-phosphate reductase n=1 Tax=Myxococcus qinghaiensis TaxID=2906758 RepID=UPI0020A8308F|nr:N-acetyl-gamma-glutamyl-phosphate reductase [Myxococcus qinghaiensis]MCP3162985.1 N-acetyl-gamma-glutamyl-phosphate reductase [Myxococcus qinghaiensis]